ncbi:MAG: hypothetical protein IKM88_07140 [Lachnospiraceae bacterium]|nr:hypothetical protein [Lachnospiraceae bacterium]
MAEIIYTNNHTVGEQKGEIELRAEGSEELIKSLATMAMDFMKGGASQETKTVQVTKPERIGDTECDVVAIYDNAGIPSFMHRFRKVTNKELFGGADKTHPAFIIGGEEYDEIFISVYENTMINGKPYSLPFQKPAVNITIEDFAAACFSKGEGWHCMTAAEWGLLANLSLKNGTLPNGNTNYGKYNADENETGETYGGGKTLTGSGPATWTHNHKPTGVHDLCGNIYEFCRGMRIKNGVLYAAENNDAALPETDLSENGNGWREIKDNKGSALRVSVDEEEGEIEIDGDERYSEGYLGRRWKDISVYTDSEQMKELAMYAGEPDVFCWIDSTEGEYILIRGGVWYFGAGAGVFYSDLHDARSSSRDSFGGRSAYFKKHSTQGTDTLNAER